MHVEIWSDIACPWCYVAKRRFEAALARYEHRDEVTITWRSFELDPQAPPARDVDGATHLAQKYGMSCEEAVAMQDRMTQTAAAERLGLSVPGMKSRVQRGRGQLRVMLLRCCEIETDRRGRVVAFETREGERCAACGGERHEMVRVTVGRLNERPRTDG